MGVCFSQRVVIFVTDGIVWSVVSCYEQTTYKNVCFGHVLARRLHYVEVFGNVSGKEMMLTVLEVLVNMDAKWFRVDVCLNADGVSEVVKSFSVMATDKDAAFDIAAEAKFGYDFDHPQVRIVIREE